MSLRINTIYGNEKEGMASGLNKTDAENIKAINTQREKYNAENKEDYDQINISGKAKVAYRAKEVISQLQGSYIEEKEAILKYQEIIEEGKYLSKKISEIVAGKLRNKLVDNNIDEFVEFPMARKDYLAYKIANHLVN